MQISLFGLTLVSTAALNKTAIKLHDYEVAVYWALEDSCEYGDCQDHQITIAKHHYKDLVDLNEDYRELFENGIT